MQPISLEESMLECQEFIQKHEHAQATVKPTDEQVVLHWTSKHNGYTGHGSPQSINYLRAYLGKADLMVGSAYSDADCDYLVVRHPADCPL
jgi:hypothetical protein